MNNDLDLVLVRGHSAEDITNLQKSLIEMGFDVVLVNNVITHFHIVRFEQALDYMIKIEGMWNHPFVSNNLEDICEVCSDSKDKHYQSKRELTGRSSKEITLQPQKSKEIIPITQEKLCEICLCEINQEEKLQCGHSFCNSCLREYLVQKIKISDIEHLNCPQSKCEYVFNKDQIKTLVNDELYQKYLNFSLRAELMRNPNLIMCPFPDCTSYAYVSNELLESGNINNENEINRKRFKAKLIEIDKENENLRKCLMNKHEFCFKCRSKFHPGLNCERFLEKEFHNYAKIENVKNCPKCQFYIKKIDGCNHITCGNPLCKNEFCWICLNDYKPNHYSEGECEGLQYSNENSMAVRLRMFRKLRTLLTILTWFLFGVVILLIISLMFLTAPIYVCISSINSRTPYAFKKVKKWHRFYKFIEVSFLAILAFAMTSQIYLLIILGILLSPIALTGVGIYFLLKCCRLI